MYSQILLTTKKRDSTPAHPPHALHLGGVHWSAPTCALLLLLIWTAFPSCQGSDTRNRLDDPLADARREIQDLMEENGIASFQVAVAREGKIIFDEGFGWANLQKGIPTTTHTLYPVASIEKPFISTALMILAERGFLNLHDPIDSHLNGAKFVAYQGEAVHATVARMMLRVSGFPYGHYVCGKDLDPNKRRSLHDLLSLAGVLVAPPGRDNEYTNLGYGVLDEVVRNASGATVQDFIMKEIVGPLRLTHTRYFTAPPPATETATQNIDGGTLPFIANPNGYSGLYSTAGDLARFGMFHLKAHLPDHQRILSDSSIHLLKYCKGLLSSITARRIA